MWLHASLKQKSDVNNLSLKVEYVKTGETCLFFYSCNICMVGILTMLVMFSLKLMLWLKYKNYVKSFPGDFTKHKDC